MVRKLGLGSFRKFNCDLAIQWATWTSITTPETATGCLLFAGPGLLAVMMEIRDRIAVGLPQAI
jgi:hypothetical protein